MKQNFLARYTVMLVLLFCTSVSSNAQTPVKKKQRPATAVIDKRCSTNDCAGTTSLNISTGINPQTGALLTVGSMDGVWRLVNYPPVNDSQTHPVTIPNAYVIRKYQSGWNDISGAGILSFISNPRFEPNNLYRGQPWRFRRNFCLCRRDKVKISGLMRADDAGAIKVYDSSGALMYSKEITGNHAYNTDTPFDTDLTLNAGSYFVEFELVNIGGGGTGFVVKGSIESATRSAYLQNPSRNCCKKSGFVSVQKILEKENCNGKRDRGDTPGAGWTFVLKNTNGAVVQTKETDSNGEAFFNGVGAGNYTVQEQGKSGWRPADNHGSSKSVTVSPNGGAQVYFFNCRDNTKFCCPGKNLVRNPSFEFLNTEFASEFIYTDDVSSGAVVPGKYNIITGAQAEIISNSWDSVQDPSTCNSSQGYFLAVNGQTGGSPLQRGGDPVPEKKVVWEQDFKINTWTDYKFCFKAKNLSQVGFPTRPKLDVIFTNGGMNQDILNKDINTPNGKCDWMTVEKAFNYRGTGNGNLKIQIVLHQDKHGDGNDLALDDIALIVRKKCPVEVAKFTALLNPQNGYFTVDVESKLSSKCNKGAWAVCEVESSNLECKNNSEVYNPQQWWVENTNFPGYDGVTAALSGTNPGKFLNGRLYRIKRGVFGDCHAWNEYSVIVGMPLNSNQAVQYTEAEFKKRKVEILQKFGF